MSKVKIQGHSSGSGTVTITAPNTNSDRTLTIPDITGTALTSADTGTVTQAIVHPDAVNTFISGRKNLIINGGFDVWQRGTSFTAPAWATGSGWSADRWRISTSNSSLTAVKAVGRDTYNTLKITMAGVTCAFDQRIEAFGNVAYNKQFTVSFWVRGSGSFNGNVCRVRNHTTATNIEDVFYNVTTSWTKVTVTFSANNTWSKDDVCRLYILNNTVLASGDWIEFSNVQLELGDQATDFEHRSYGEELALCQRYYIKSLGYGSTHIFPCRKVNSSSGGNNTGAQYDIFRITGLSIMRTTPSLIHSNPTLITILAESGGLLATATGVPTVTKSGTGIATVSHNSADTTTATQIRFMEPIQLEAEL